MPKCLSEQQIEKYRRDGFVYPIDVMSADDARQYLQRLEASEAQSGTRFAKGANFKPHLVFKWASELIFHTSVLDAVEDLIGPDITLFTSTILPKSPGDGQIVDWHQDGTYFALDPDDVQVQVWLALADAPVESGCMEMAVGSHKQGQQMHREVISDRNLLSLGQTVDADTDRFPKEFMPLRAGQLSMHHTHVFHRSAPNLASWRRVGFVYTFVPSYTRVRANVRTSATLVRGVDRWNLYEEEPRPETDMGAKELEFQRHANDLFRAVYSEERKRYSVA